MFRLAFVLAVLCGCSTGQDCLEIKAIEDGFEFYQGGEIVAEFTATNTDSLSLETLAILFDQVQAAKTGKPLPYHPRGMKMAEVSLIAK